MSLSEEAMAAAAQPQPTLSAGVVVAEFGVLAQVDSGLVMNSSDVASYTSSKTCLV
jgi:hypothetical protein